MPFLVLDHLVKRFPSRDAAGSETAAVDDVSLDVEAGEMITLLGPSGCGKTTTLRMIAGFESPTSGRIVLDGRELQHLPPNRRGMAMVFQSYALFPHLSVFENVAYGLRVQHTADASLRERVIEALDLVGLAGLENRAPNQLSGGQQQRVALARALVIRPRVLLFDEPLSNLDATLREQMRFQIRQLQRRLGITAVYVTHDQSEAMVLSDRIVVMSHGHIQQVGPPGEVYRRPSSRFVAGFLGRASFLPGRVISGPPAPLVEIQGVRFPATGPGAAQAGAEVTCVLRPEALVLSPADTPMGDPAVTPMGDPADGSPSDDQQNEHNGSASRPGLPGVVQRAAFLGPVVDYEVAVGGGLLTVHDRDVLRETPFREGAKVLVQPLANSVYVLPSDGDERLSGGAARPA